MLELARDTYKYVGMMVAASIVHGDPAPCFFAESVVDYIMYGIECVKGNLDDIEDFSVREKLEKVCAM